MGWDTVAIGTNHNLPIDNPIATAQRLIPLIDAPISVGHWNEYRFDPASNSICETAFVWHELSLINGDKSGSPIKFEIVGYDARKIIETLRGNFDGVSFDKPYSKEYFEDYEPFCIYNIEGDSFYCRIFNENIDLNYSYPGRWSAFESTFRQHYVDENRKRLDEFRSQIFKQLQAFGCDKAYYFSDQGDGEKIFNEINLSSQLFVDRINSGIHSSNPEQILTFDVADYIQGKRMLSPEECALCFIDSFSDFDC